MSSPRASSSGMEVKFEKPLSVSEIAKNETSFSDWCGAHRSIRAKWDAFTKVPAHSTILSLLNTSAPVKTITRQFVEKFDLPISHIFPSPAAKSTLLRTLLDEHPTLMADPAENVDGKQDSILFLLICDLQRIVRDAQIKNDVDWILAVHEPLIRSALCASGGTSTLSSVGDKRSLNHYTAKLRYALPKHQAMGQTFGQVFDPGVLKPTYCQPDSALWFGGEPDFDPTNLTDNSGVQHLLGHEVSILRSGTKNYFPTLQFEKKPVPSGTGLDAVENSHVNQLMIYATCELRHRGAFQIEEPFLSLLFEGPRAYMLVHWSTLEDHFIVSRTARVPGSALGLDGDCFDLSKFIHALHLHRLIQSISLWTSIEFKLALEKAIEKFSSNASHPVSFQWKLPENGAPQAVESILSRSRKRPSSGSSLSKIDKINDTGTVRTEHAASGPGPPESSQDGHSHDGEDQGMDVDRQQVVHRSQSQPDSYIIKWLKGVRSANSGSTSSTSTMLETPPSTPLDNVSHKGQARAKPAVSENTVAVVGRKALVDDNQLVHLNPGLEL